MRKPISVILLLAIALVACGGEEVRYDVDDLAQRLGAAGHAVEDRIDLAEVGHPSAQPGRMFLLTLADDTQLLVHVTGSAKHAARVLAVESKSAEAAGKLGIRDADTYSRGAAFGNLTVLVEDAAPRATAREIVAALEE